MSTARKEHVNKVKPYVISKHLIWEAYKNVKAKKGAGGVDNVPLQKYEENLKDNLYKLWNRMSSGSYLPKPVKAVSIRKSDGGERILGIPCIDDRIAQMAVVLIMTPIVEPIFHKDSYGYRPHKSALDAVAITRERCWRKDWVIDLDIKSFFDSIDHELMMRLLKKHIQTPWILLYVERWLKSPMQNSNGELIARTKGTPQGGVISPLLANIFMHHVFDIWLSQEFPDVEFARYADDIVVHTYRLSFAKQTLRAIQKRFARCGLQLHPEKTQIVYCKGNKRQWEYEKTKFDFLGFTFRPRVARNRQGEV